MSSDKSDTSVVRQEPSPLPTKIFGFDFVIFENYPTKNILQNFLVGVGIKKKTSKLERKDSRDQICFWFKFRLTF